MPIYCAKYELWPSMLWKKMTMVKDCVIVQIVNLGGYTQTGGGMKRGC